MPASDGGDDAVRVGCPDERFRVRILLGDEAVDGGLEIDQRMEGAAFEPPSCELGEEAFHGVEPRA